MHERWLVIDPSTGDIVNAIVVDQEVGPPELEGVELVRDEWGAGPGDRWDAEQRCAVRVERQPEQVLVLPPEIEALRAIVAETEAAAASGDAAKLEQLRQQADAVITPREVP